MSTTDQALSTIMEAPVERDSVNKTSVEDKAMDSLSTEKSSEKDATDPQSLVDAPTTGLRLFLTLVGLQISVFCVALDNTIITTAIPRITDRFHALRDVGWYGSAYLLTTCAFQLFFGKLYYTFNIKVVFLAAIFLFELGSLIAGVAPNSIALIWGRVISGIGSAGIFSGAVVIIAKITPLEKRAAYTGSLAAMYGIASVVGPLLLNVAGTDQQQSQHLSAVYDILGGVFTDKLTWRWCFYINLPIGAITVATVILALRLPNDGVFKNIGWKKSLWRLDPIGSVCFIASIVCLLLALQWGGTTYAWSSARVVVLLVFFAVALLVFIGVQVWMKDHGTVPPRVALQQTIAFGSLFAFLLGGSLFLLMYFLPIWFQAVKGTDALRSGIDTIPLIMSNTVGIFFSAGLVTKFGWYMPFVFLNVVLTSIATGLMITLNVDTSVGKWVGYQILFGFGCGCAFQIPQLAAQAVLSVQDVPIGVAVTIFASMFGGSLFVSVANNVLNNALVKNIGHLNIPGIDPRSVILIGATELRQVIPAAYLPQAINAYNASVIDTFKVALITSCLSILGAAGMQWKSLKQGPQPANP